MRLTSEQPLMRPVTPKVWYIQSCTNLAQASRGGEFDILLRRSRILELFDWRTCDPVLHGSGPGHEMYMPCQPRYTRHILPVRPSAHI